MDQKLENLLEISLEADRQELEASPQLSFGFDDDSDRWEVIVRYAGGFDDLIGRYSESGVSGYELLNNFAVLNSPSEVIELLGTDPDIDYIEKPKRLFFTLEEAKADICLNNSYGVGNSLSFLDGRGVIVAVIDTGIDIADNDFRNEDGSTRIEWLWDQTLEGNMTQYGFGVEYSRTDIDSALEDGRTITTDFAMHGTSVAAIACGNRGVAPFSTIVVVKLDVNRDYGFSWTTKLMAAIDYVVRKASDMAMPVAINISLGSNYGSHRGDSLLEQYIDSVSDYGRNVICVGCGNEAANNIHRSFMTESYREYVAELGVAPNESSISFQLWGYYWDNFETIIVAPDGSSFGPLETQNSLIRYRTGATQILGFRGTASPGSILQEVYYDLIPVNGYISSGIWKIIIRTGKIKAGRIDIWLQTGTNLNTNTGFVRPDPDMTITIPATASSVISVGAYNQRSNTYAVFSGRGIEEPGFWNVFKPDISAPGVNIAVKPGRFVTGTSFAVAFVTGGAALLMEWGIVRGNDSFLYGQKVKAMLIDKTLPLPGESVPSDKVGWGKVCIIT